MNRSLPLGKNLRLFFSKLFISWLLLLPAVAARAQFTGGCPTKFGGDEIGGFVASTLEGCAPLTVQVTKNSPLLLNDKYFYNYRGGDYKQPTFDLQFSTRTDTTYTKPGEYIILQLGSKGGRPTFFCQKIEVHATPRPKFNVVSCALGRLTLTIPDDPSIRYDSYSVDWGDGSSPATVLAGSTTIQSYGNNGSPRRVRVTGQYAGVSPSCAPSADTTVAPRGTTPTRPSITSLEVTGSSSALLKYSSGGPSPAFFDILKKDAGGTYQKILAGVGGGNATSFSQTIQGLSEGQSCFKVANAADACATTPLESDELCTIPLTVTARNQRNTLQWVAHPISGPLSPFRQYEVTKGSFPLLPILTDRSTDSMSDTDVQCGLPYTYQVKARVGTMVSISQRVTVTAINTTPPPPLTDVLTTVEQGRILITWLPPAGSYRAFNLSRASGGGTFQSIGDTLTNRFSDNVDPANGPFCYRVTYQDLCGNTSPPSEPACPIFLRQEGSGLMWTPYAIFLAGLSGYTVEQIDANGNFVQSQNVGNVTAFQPNVTNATTQEVRFRVQAVSTNGLRSFSNDVVFTLPLRLFVPEAFSPNGDGINDTFVVKGIFLQNFRMRIFNRWGESVFQSDSAEGGWDGTINGQAATEGNYVYSIEVEDVRGERFVKRGGFLLLR